MKKEEKWYSKRRKLLAVGILSLKLLDATLLPIDRLVFFRILLRYGFKKISLIDNGNIKKISKEIDIHYLKVRKSFDNLVEKGGLDLDTKGNFRIRKQLLRLIELKGHIDFKSIKSVNFFLDSIPRLDFLLQLLDLTLKVKVSHKQKSEKFLLNINFKQWLVLLNLVVLSDKKGIVFRASSGELSNRTGMSRFALLRAITELFKLGILRSKNNGTVNNNLIKSVAATYSINLSHTIWGDFRIYCNYYSIKYPIDGELIIQQVFNLVNDIPYIENEDVLVRYFNSREKFYELKYNPSLKIYKYYYNDLKAKFFSYYTRVISDEGFTSTINFLKFSYNLDKIEINKKEENIGRVDFILNYVFLSQVRRFYGFDYFSMNQFPTNQMKDSLREHINFNTEFNTEIDTHNSLMIDLFFSISQASFRSEVLPILNFIKAHQKLGPLDAMHVTVLPLQSSICSDKIFFMPNGKSSDEYYSITFVPIAKKSYIFTMEYNLLNEDSVCQKTYGLLHPEFETFEI